MKNNLLTAILIVFQIIDVFCQSDLVVGTSYQLNLQRQNAHGDAWILHNAEFSSGTDVLKWKSNHSTFGARGIRFAYYTGRGIYFYAQEGASTAGAEFTPITRFFIGNDGKIGIGTVSPTTLLDLGGLHFDYISSFPSEGSVMEGSWGTYLLGDNTVARALRLGVSNDSYTRAEINLDNGNRSDGTISFKTANANGGAVSRMFIKGDGNVGIGTTTPNAKLHINGGDLLLQNQTSGYPILWLKNVSGSQSIRLDYNSIIGAGGNLYLRSGTSNNILLNDVGGGVGIGTSNVGTFKLAVNGKIWAQEVQVALTNPGPDYVFEPNYKLLSLEEIKAYISQHKHLPEVPSAKEMETNGVNVSEMNMLLLKKIEELTLYQIEATRQIQSLKTKVQELESKLN